MSRPVKTKELKPVKTSEEYEKQKQIYINLWEKRSPTILAVALRQLDTEFKEK